MPKITLRTLFGEIAGDIEEHAKEGYIHALAVHDPAAMEEAWDIATNRHGLTNPDMRFSPPIAEHQIGGYMVLKDEELAASIQLELLLDGFECTRVKNGDIQPPPPFL